jgi:hypothetical protein
MKSMDDLLKHFQELRDQNLADAAKLESGKFCMHESRDGKIVIQR